jgi:hypothetical protein
MIDHIYDYDNQFVRMVAIALSKTLSKYVRWINYFSPTNSSSSGLYRVVLPFYTSLTVMKDSFLMLSLMILLMLE